MKQGGAMSASNPRLDSAVDAILETLPPVWDRIRFNLRVAGVSKFGISLEQFHTLRHIRKGYCHTGELAEKMMVSKPAASQAVSALAAKGLVVRVPEAGDRRLVRLELSKSAHEVMDANFRENRAWTRGRMAGLPPEDLDCVLRAMEILRAAFASDTGGGK
jgi:DNA-binding MarR family transcriptional regulator